MNIQTIFNLHQQVTILVDGEPIEGKKLLNGHKIADCINRAAGEQEFIISEEAS